VTTEEKQEGRDFPWTWDQFQRYSVLGEILAAFSPPGGKPLRVLDVGGVSPGRTGMGIWFPVRRIHNGPSVVCDVLDVQGQDYVRASGLALPFPDRIFDVVAAMDVLEHVPAAGRDAFLRDMCRVSAGFVILSAPCRDSQVEAVESLLFEQIRRLYGLDHAQLLEHRQHGLPEAAFVADVLGGEMPAAASFGFGSLADDLLFQYNRNHFLLQRASGGVLEALDRFMAARGAAYSLKPPFARMFWVHGRNVSQAVLQRRVRRVLDRLTKGMPSGMEPPSAADLAAEIKAYHAQDMVSALVALPSGTKRLAACLDHLLTQETDFDLEVCVWDPEERPQTRRFLAGAYPGVRVLGSTREGTTAGGFLRAAGALRGGWTLLLSDRTLLPRDAAARLLARAREAGEGAVLAPRAVRRRYFDATWSGGRFALKRLVAGRIPHLAAHALKGGPGEEESGAAKRTPDLAWIYGECLIFRKSDACARRLPGGSLGRRDVFLWVTSGREVRLSVAADVTVYVR